MCQRRLLLRVKAAQVVNHVLVVPQARERIRLDGAYADVGYPPLPTDRDTVVAGLGPRLYEWVSV